MSGGEYYRVLSCYRLPGPLELRKRKVMHQKYISKLTTQLNNWIQSTDAELESVKS